MVSNSSKRVGKAKASATSAPAVVKVPVREPVPAAPEPRVQVAKKAAVAASGQASLTLKAATPMAAAPKVEAAKAEAPKAAAPKVEAPKAAAPRPVAAKAAPVASAPAKSAAKPELSLVAAVPESVRALAAQSLKLSQENYATVRGKAESFNASVDAGMRQAVTGFQSLNSRMIDLCLNQGKAQVQLATALVATKNPAEAVKLAQEFTQSNVKAWQSFGDAWLQMVRQSGTGLFKA